MRASAFFTDGVMATLENLVGTIAEVEGIGVERVRAIGRAIREAGLIRTGGRGRSAAEMSARAAANLLIAVNVAHTAGTAAEMVHRYRELRAHSNPWSSYFGPEFERLLSAVSRGVVAESVANLVRLAPNRSALASNTYELEEYEITIRFHKPTPGVTMYVTAPRGLRNVDVINFYTRTKDPSTTFPDRTITVAITERTIIAVGKLLRN